MNRELRFQRRDQSSNQPLRASGRPAGLTGHFSPLPRTKIILFLSIPRVGEQREELEALTLGIADSMFTFACLRLGSSETILNTGLSSWFARWSRKAQQGSREVRLGDSILQVCVTKQITAVRERDFLLLGGRGDLFQGLSTTEGARKAGYLSRTSIRADDCYHGEEN